MSFEFKCACGEILTVESGMHGRDAFCPHCRRTVKIPPPPAETADEIEAVVAEATSTDARVRESGEKPDDSPAKKDVVPEDYSRNQHAAAKEAGKGAEGDQSVTADEKKTSAPEPQEGEKEEEAKEKADGEKSKEEKNSTGAEEKEEASSGDKEGKEPAGAEEKDGGGEANSENESKKGGEKVGQATRLRAGKRATAALNQSARVVLDSSRRLPQAEYEDEVFEPVRVTQVKDQDGSPVWKLTCTCGKRILSPFHVGKPTGRCPKCSRRLRLPGYRSKSGKVRSVGKEKEQRRKPAEAEDKNKAAAKKPPPVPAEEEPLRLADEEPLASDDDEVGTIVIESPPDVPRFQRDAALRTADRLRRHKVEESAGESDGRISAWPLAGRGPRVLAGFIDLTAALLLTGVVLALASFEVLPKSLTSLGGATAIFFLAAVFNDGFFQLLGGTVGKRIVVVVMRARDGRRPSAGVVFLRALLKWLFIPGWLLALADPAERTLHDLICRTLVLKGRPRK